MASPRTRAIVYDADNRPVEITAGGGTVAYLYGPDGARLKKVAEANTTLYLGADIERDPAGAFTFYVASDGNLVDGVSHTSTATL
jgi:YD repeat-containing protein